MQHLLDGYIYLHEEGQRSWWEQNSRFNNPNNLTYLIWFCNSCYFFMLAVFHGSSRALPFPAWDICNKAVRLNDRCWTSQLIGMACLKLNSNVVGEWRGLFCRIRVKWAISGSVDDIITMSDTSAHTQMHSSPWGDHVSHRFVSFIKSCPHMHTLLQVLFILFNLSLFSGSTGVWIITSLKRQIIFIMQCCDRRSSWGLCTA